MAVIGTPHVFLARDCSSLAEARHVDGSETEGLLFEPGFLALEVLCRVVAGRPLSAVRDAASSFPFEYLDGPNNPVSDEGFQLFRVADLVVRQLSDLSPSKIEEIASASLQELGKFGQGPPALAVALTGLVALVRRGENTGQALLVKILYR